MWIWHQPDWPEWDFLLDDDTLENLFQIRSMPLPSKKTGIDAHTRLADSVTIEAIRTSAIEGEYLSLNDTYAVAADRLGAEPPAIMPNEQDPRAEGVVEMLLLARRTTREPVSKRGICALHEKLLGYRRGTVSDAIGDYRRTHVMIRSARGIIYEAPGSDAVPRLMDHYIEWCNRPLHLPTTCAPSLPTQWQNDQQLLAPVKAAIGHMWFERIHPFFDGNGRVGRALAEQMVNRSERHVLPLSEIIGMRQSDYYRKLGTYGKMAQGNDISAWIAWFVDVVHAAHQQTHMAERQSPSLIDPVS